MGNRTELPVNHQHLNPERDERRAVELRGYLVRADNQIVDFRVLDLSYEGCGIETITALAPGEKVKISVLGRGAISAKVQWCAGRKAGLLFLYEKAVPRKRAPRADRTPVEAQVFLRRSSKPGYNVKAFDVSRHGCKCEFVERPKIDECVWIKFDGLELIEAKVSWVEGSAAGFKFSKPMHPAVFDMLLQGWNPPPAT